MILEFSMTAKNPGLTRDGDILSHLYSRQDTVTDLKLMYTE